MHDEPSELLNVPAAHKLQAALLLAPVMLLALPGGHSVHVVCPSLLLNDPGPHAEHAARPVNELDVPRGHGRHAALEFPFVLGL